VRHAWAQVHLMRQELAPRSRFVFLSRCHSEDLELFSVVFERPSLPLPLKTTTNHKNSTTQTQKVCNASLRLEGAAFTACAAKLASFPEARENPSMASLPLLLDVHRLARAAWLLRDHKTCHDAGETWGKDPCSTSQRLRKHRTNGYFYFHC